jgi:hypothetical protein
MQTSRIVCQVRDSWEYSMPLTFNYQITSVGITQVEAMSAISHSHMDSDWPIPSLTLSFPILLVHSFATPNLSGLTIKGDPRLEPKWAGQWWHCEGPIFTPVDSHIVFDSCCLNSLAQTALQGASCPPSMGNKPLVASQIFKLNQKTQWGGTSNGLGFFSRGEPAIKEQ